MKYFVALLHIADEKKNLSVRPRHLIFLREQEAQGRIFARGPFADGTGGLVIYQAQSLDEARKLAGSDPYVTEGARRLELHEWEMVREG